MFGLYGLFSNFYSCAFSKPGLKKGTILLENVQFENFGSLLARLILVDFQLILYPSGAKPVLKRRTGFIIPESFFHLQTFEKWATCKENTTLSAGISKKTNLAN